MGPVLTDPSRTERFLDLMLADAAWVRAEFDALVEEEEWSDPPPDPPASGSGGRVPWPDRDGSQRTGGDHPAPRCRPSQAPDPGRQRSPPPQRAADRPLRSRTVP